MEREREMIVVRGIVWKIRGRSVKPIGMWKGIIIIMIS
jgi:hypothetical protein